MRTPLRYFLALFIALPGLAAGLMLTLIYIPRVTRELQSMHIESSLNAWQPLFWLVEHSSIVSVVVCVCFICFEHFAPQANKGKVRWILLSTLIGGIYACSLALSIAVISEFDTLRTKQSIQMKFYESYLLEKGAHQPIIDIAGDVYYQSRQQEYLNKK